MKLSKTKGFTLIELMVVISIISLLSSIVFSTIKDARIRARDTQRKIEFNQIHQAMYLYYDKYGSAIPNQDTTSPWTNNFQLMAQILVNEGFLSSVPVSPCGTTCSYTQGGYSYYNYGSNYGAMILTTLETGPSTTTGIPPSCRPTPNAGNLCDNVTSTKEYCMCFPR